MLNRASTSTATSSTSPSKSSATSRWPSWRPAAIEREYGIVLDEDLLTDADTPRALIEAVNQQFGADEPAAA